MAGNLAQASPSDPVRTLDGIRPSPAKAGLRCAATSEGVLASDPIGQIAWAAVIAHYGSVKAAAISMRNVDPSLLRREITAGHLGRLDTADDSAIVKAAVSEAFGTAFGHMTDPKAYVRQALRDIRRRCDDIEQSVEGS